MIENAVWSDKELASIQNKDRLLPSQPYFSKMYRGSDFYGDLQETLCKINGWRVFDIETKDGMTYAAMGSDYNTLHFYQFLIRSHGFKKVLELGTYIGVSAMYMADAGAHVTTVEKGDEFFEIAKENIRKNGFGLNILPCLGEAYEILEGLHGVYGMYDFILIDCAKESYKELLELSLSRLAPNGLILVDDVFFQGDTLNAVQTSEKGIGVRRMLDYAATLDDYEKIILPIGNGLLMVRKK